jgi:hypothetical protein
MRIPRAVSTTTSGAILNKSSTDAMKGTAMSDEVEVETETETTTTVTPGNEPDSETEQTEESEE